MYLACGVDLSHRLGHKICEIIIPNENLYKVQTLRKNDKEISRYASYSS